ncbi:hypothetical protein TNCV_3147991 [Trichonephila clavipes]|nr:hypothetical protein TNCV_3147991 [Trichonephila clavipes]
MVLLAGTGDKENFLEKCSGEGLGLLKVVEPTMMMNIRRFLIGSTRGLLATDHVILNHGQVTWTTPELAPPLLTKTKLEAQWLSGSASRFHTTNPRFKPRAGLWNLTLGVSHQTDHLSGTSAHAPQGPRSRIQIWQGRHRSS